MLLIAAVKEVVEDRRRHLEDRKVNEARCRILQQDGSTQEAPWKELRMGQMVLVRDDEMVPADLLLLHSSLPEQVGEPFGALVSRFKHILLLHTQVCFIRTTNLDGETNLKIRSVLKGLPLASPADCLGLRGMLVYETPRADLHHFHGQFHPLAPQPGDPQRVLPVSINEVLLRGSQLKNTGEVVGLVVYVGPDTRVQQNSRPPRAKLGAYDRFLNLQISLVILLQLVLCALFAMGGVLWRNGPGQQRYFLAMSRGASPQVVDPYVEGQYSNSGVQWIILFLTMWILLSYMVPISLFVTIEIVKGIQGFLFINQDSAMVSPETGDSARQERGDTWISQCDAIDASANAAGLGTRHSTSRWAR